MSIADKLTQLETDITSAYGAIQTKGGTVPQNKNTNNLSNAIGSIPAGSQVAKGLVFSDYDADGYPHTAEFVGTWTTIPDHYCYRILNGRVNNWSGQDPTITKYINTIEIPQGVEMLGFRSLAECNSLLTISLPSTLNQIDQYALYKCQNLQNVTIPQGVTGIGSRAFDSCWALQSVVFSGNISSISNNTFYDCNKCVLYDFSHCSAIPSLYSTASLGHKSGCVIRIPSALSDTTLGTGSGWESETNWSALTNIVWEVV